MCIIVIIMSLLLSGCVRVEDKQLRATEKWEQRTFLNQPPGQVMDAAGIKPGMVIGELGAGRGRFTLHLARRVGPSGRILANDIDADSLELLRYRCRRAGIPNVEIILGKIDNPLFPEGALDMAFMVWTYHFFDQPVAMLKSLLSALKPGAVVVLVEPDPVRGPGGADHGITPDRMRREAEQAGFELVRTETILPEDLIFVLRVKDGEDKTEPSAGKHGG